MGSCGKSFDGADQSHREQMRIARVALFFNCNFRRSEPGSPLIPCMLALVNRLREFTVPEARKSHAPYITYTLTCSNRTQWTAEGPLQERGTRISYECNPIRDLRVIPAANIIKLPRAAGSHLTPAHPVSWPSTLCLLRARRAPRQLHTWRSRSAPFIRPAPARASTPARRP